MKLETAIKFVKGVLPMWEYQADAMDIRTLRQECIAALSLVEQPLGRPRTAYKIARWLGQRGLTRRNIYRVMVRGR